MELITQGKLQSLRNVTLKCDRDYRYNKVCQYIKDLEEEDNIIALPTIDQDHLIYLRLQKAKIEAEEMGDMEE
jgi:hypothetical protein